MTRVGATSPEMMRRVLAATRRIETQHGSVISDDAFQEPGRIVVRNVSTFTIPEFGLMQIKLATNQAGYKIIEVQRPFSQSFPSSVFLLNGPFSIAPNEFGTAQSGPVYRAKTSISHSIGTRLGWKADSFEATFGCLFSVIGTDNITTNVARVITDFSMLHGIVTTAIAASMGAAGEVQTLDPTTTHKAKTRKSAIAVGDEVFLWPSKGEWIAARVC